MIASLGAQTAIGRSNRLRQLPAHSRGPATWLQGLSASPVVTWLEPTCVMPAASLQGRHARRLVQPRAMARPRRQTIVSHRGAMLCGEPAKQHPVSAWDSGRRVVIIECRHGQRAGQRRQRGRRGPAGEVAAATVGTEGAYAAASHLLALHRSCQDWPSDTRTNSAAVDTFAECIVSGALRWS